jgi:hypothetical protein
MNSCLKFLLVLSFAIAAATLCSAQDRLQPIPTPQAKEVDRAEADETFDLNIGERHITERDFAASTSVGLDQTNLHLQIGVALRAQNIDVLLRNVRGTVRFRGSVQRILEILNLRAKTTPSP